MSGQDPIPRPQAYEGVRAVNPPDLVKASRAPTSNDKKYPIGTLWVNKVTQASYQLDGFTAGAPVWVALGGGATALATLTGDSGGAISPTGGNINLLGTANQIATTGSGSTITASLVGPYTPATYTAHGVLIGEGTSSIVATSAGSAGQVLTSGGASADPAWTTATFPATATAGSLIAATATNVIGQIADVATGQVLASGGVGVIPAYTGSPSVSGSLTAGLGNITATNGNIVRGTAGNKDVYSSVATTITAGANSAGTVTLVAGEAVVSTTAVTANSQIRIYRQGVGATGAAALGILSILTRSAGVSFTIRAVQPADATAAQAADVSVIAWEIVN